MFKPNANCSVDQVMNVVIIIPKQKKSEMDICKS